MMFGLDKGACYCGNKATTIIVMLLNVDRKHEFESIYFGSLNITNHVQTSRTRLLANTELFYACDTCQEMYDGFSALKCKLGNEIPKQLIEVVQEKHRLISL